MSAPRRGTSGRWQAAARWLDWAPRGFKAVVGDLLQATLPSDCRICGGPMQGVRPVRVCDPCVERVRQASEATEALCSRCGEALGMESARFAASMGVGECTSCRVSPPAFTRAVAFGSYDNEMREMLHTLKFAGMRQTAEHVLGAWMAEAMRKLRAEAAAEVLVVPVPLHRDRARERGFNQAELLARAGVRRLGTSEPGWKLVLQPGALQRVKDTRALFTLRPDQRRRNLIGAFKVPEPVRVANREVMLVDDILTTGATANACAKALLRAGATAVWVVTVARAQPESVLAAEGGVAHWDAPGPEGSGTA